MAPTSRTSSRRSKKTVGEQEEAGESSSQAPAVTPMKLRVRRRDNAAATLVEPERYGENLRSRCKKNNAKTSAPSTPPAPPVLAAEEASPDSKCPICLDRFNNLAYLDRCLHRFCFPCIQEWSHNKAECPLCKQPFASILHSVRAEDDFKEYTLRRPPSAGVAATVAMVAAMASAASSEHHMRLMLRRHRPPAAGDDEAQRRSRRRRRMWDWYLESLYDFPEETTPPSRGGSARDVVFESANARATAAPTRRPSKRRQRQREGAATVAVREPQSFARSPLDMDAYDARAPYEPPSSAPGRRSPSPVRSIISISEEEAEPIDPAGSAPGQSGWDDETPGPSYSTAEPSGSVSPAPREPTNQEEEECLIVGYKKPMAERTPELVQLSSDTEEEAPPPLRPPTSPASTSAPPPAAEPDVGHQQAARARLWSGSSTGAADWDPRPVSPLGSSGSASSPPVYSSPSPAPSPVERARRGEKPGGKRKYKSRHLDRRARDPSWKPSGSHGDEKRRRKRGRERKRGESGGAAERSPSVEIVYEGTTSSALPAARKRRRKRHREAQQTSSSPVIITLDSDSCHDDANQAKPPLTDPAGRTVTQIRIDSDDSEVDVEKMEEGGGENPSDTKLLASILCDLHWMAGLNPPPLKHKDSVSPQPPPGPFPPALLGPLRPSTSRDDAHLSDKPSTSGLQSPAKASDPSSKKHILLGRVRSEPGNHRVTSDLTEEPAPPSALLCDLPVTFTSVLPHEDLGPPSDLLATPTNPPQLRPEDPDPLPDGAEKPTCTLDLLPENPDPPSDPPNENPLPGDVPEKPSCSLDRLPESCDPPSDLSTACQPNRAALITKSTCDSPTNGRTGSDLTAPPDNHSTENRSTS